MKLKHASPPFEAQQIAITIRRTTKLPGLLHYLITSTALLPQPHYQYYSTTSLPVLLYYFNLTTSTTPLPHYQYRITTSLPVLLHYLTTSTTPLPHYQYYSTTSLPVLLHYLTTSTTPLPHYKYYFTTLLPVLPLPVLPRAYRPAKRGEGMQLTPHMPVETAKCWWLLKIESNAWAGGNGSCAVCVGLQAVGALEFFGELYSLAKGFVAHF